MKLKQGELKVFYFGDVSVERDEQIEAFFKALGYRRWASGYSIEDDVRDLAFESMEEEK